MTLAEKQRSATQSFMEIVKIHRILDSVFLEHQKALICMDGQRAHFYFNAFKELLALHIYHEDEVLLPVFSRIGDIKRWPGTLFSGEHRKLEGFLERIELALDKLGDPTPENAAEIIEVLDVEGGLKRLMEHHDEREQQCLFVVLDQVTEPTERQALLDRVFSEWFACHKKMGLTLPEGYVH